jgi:monoamine oxidase
MENYFFCGTETAPEFVGYIECAVVSAKLVAASLLPVDTKNKGILH